jgi:hypothetical protein
MRQKLDGRVVVVTGGVAVDADVIATAARVSDVGVTHGQAADKLVLVVACTRIPSMLVDFVHECDAKECSCLPKIAIKSPRRGPGLASRRLKAEVRAARTASGASTLSSAVEGTTPVPSLP